MEVTCVDLSFETVSNFIFANRTQRSCNMHFKGSMRDPPSRQVFLKEFQPFSFHWFGKFNKFKLPLWRELEIGIAGIPKTLNMAHDFKYAKVPTLHYNNKPYNAHQMHTKCTWSVLTCKFVLSFQFVGHEKC